MLEADVEVDRREFTVSVRLAVAAGERLALYGPSGSGKTTILEAIAGLIPLDRGRVALAGRVLSQTWPPSRSVPPWRRGIGLLRQDPGLFPHLDVRQNLLYGAGPRRGTPGRGSGAAQAGRIIAELGIGGLVDDRPARLSGGQAHRVALGRLLLADCGALLLDEPYTGLDAGLRRMLTDLVRGLVADREVPAALVAHELAEAQAFADRLAVLDRGRILQIGPPADVVARPACLRVAELVGYRAFVPVSQDGAILAGVHPQRVVPGARHGRGLVLTGRVRSARPAGAGWDVELMPDTPGPGHGERRGGPGGPPAGGTGRGGADAGEAGHPSGPGREMGTADAVWCHLPEQPPAPGGEAAVTVVDPPRFGRDGKLLAGSDRVRA